MFVSTEAIEEMIQQHHNGRMEAASMMKRLGNVVHSVNEWKNQQDAQGIVTSVLKAIEKLMSGASAATATRDALQILNTFFDTCPVEFLFDVVSNVQPHYTSNDNDHDLFIDILIGQALNQNESSNTYLLALSAISKWWTVKETLQDFFTGGVEESSCTVTCLWITARHEKLEQIAQVAINILTSDNLVFDTQSGWSASATDPVQVKSVCATILSSFLKEGIVGWLYSTYAQEVPSGSSRATLLCEKLFPHILHLNDNSAQMFDVHSTKLSLMSLMLVSLLEKCHYESIHQLESLLSSTSIVEYIVRVAFPTRLSTPRGPPWTLQTNNFGTRQELALGVVHVWLSFGRTPQAWSAFSALERLWMTFAIETWQAIVDPQGGRNLIHSLPSLVLLHTKVLCKASTASILSNIQGNDDRLGSLIPQALLNLSQHDDYVVAASASSIFVVMLRYDMQSIVPCDSLQDAGSWLATLLVHLVDEVSKKDTAACPSRIVIMLNSLQALSSKQDNCSQVFQNVSSQKLSAMMDTLLQAIVVPERSSESTTDGGLPDADTPKMRNLNDSDAEPFFWSQTQTAPQFTQTCLSTLNVASKISIAAVLAGLGWCPLANNDTSMLDDVSDIQLRIQTSVMEFVLDLPTLLANRPVDRDEMRRLLHLTSFLSLSSTENEKVVSSAIFSLDLKRSKELFTVRSEALAYRQQLDELSAKNDQLNKQQKAAVAELESSNMVHERQIQRIQAYESAKSSRLVQLATTERMQAETKVQQLEEKVAEVAAQQRQAENETESARACQDLLRAELEEVTLKMKEIEEQLQSSQETLREKENREQQVQAELNEANKALQGMQNQLEEKNDEIQETNKCAKALDGECQDLHDHVEEIYSTLIEFSKAYQAKEQEHLQSKEKLDNDVASYKKKLEKEKGRNEILEDSEDRLSRENDRLTKKLAKYKEKLEQERRERHEELERRKRHGPVSYLNQLHDESMRSDKSGRLYGKENVNNSKHRSSNSSRRRLYR